MRKWVLLDELGLWLWTSQWYALLPSGCWWLPPSTEVTADNLPGPRGGGQPCRWVWRGAAPGWASWPSTSREEQVLNFWMSGFSSGFLPK